MSRCVISQYLLTFPALRLSPSPLAGMFVNLMEGQEPGILNAFEDQIREYHKEHDSNGDGVLNSVSMNCNHVNQIHNFCSV